jgi:SulP family sulfate permease
MVAIETCDWKSLKALQKMPLSEAFIMPLTVIIVIWTHDLAKGVVVGVVVSSLIFAWKLAQIKTTTSFESDGEKLYKVSGQLFFGSMTNFVELFNYSKDPEKIVIDFSDSHLWDHSAVTAVSTVVRKYRKLNKDVTLVGLNEESQLFMHKLGVTGLSVQ